MPPELRTFAVGSAAAHRRAARAQQAAPGGAQAPLFRLVFVSAHAAPALDPDDAARAPPRPAPPRPAAQESFVRKALCSPGPGTR